MSNLEIKLPSPHEPELYHYYKGLDDREFYINDEIDSLTLDMIALPMLRADQKDSKTPIRLYISTPGGSVFDGLVICDIIEQIKSPLEIIVLGYAYSMGALILMAGANKPNITRKCYQFSTGLIHGGSNILAGTSSQVKDFYKFQERYEEKIKAYVLARTNFTEDEYKSFDREEIYMTAEEMKARGLIDEIIE